MTTNLIECARNMVRPGPESGSADVPEAVRDFIEALTFAAASDIVAMINVMLEEDWMALAPWARNLAFRLACLQRPDDAELLRRASEDLFAFGPDWDDVAEALEARASRLEGTGEPDGQ